MQTGITMLKQSNSHVQHGFQPAAVMADLPDAA